MRKLLLLVCATAICLGMPFPFAAGQTSYPMLTDTFPVAVQRGKATDIMVEGQMDFSGIYKVLFDEPGFNADVLETPLPKPGRGRRGKQNPNRKPTPRSVKLRLTVATGARLGVHEFRLASSLGISSVGQLVVVEDPVVQESGDNNTLARANPIPVPCVVSGRIEAAEDVDFYKFHATAGETITFDVQCARLQDKIHDLQKHA